jgi:hypothetical protein
VSPGPHAAHVRPDLGCPRGGGGPAEGDRAELGGAAVRCGAAEEMDILGR